MCTYVCIYIHTYIYTSVGWGKVATVTVLVCILPLVSVVGTLCTLCTPASYFSIPNTPSPWTPAEALFSPPTVLCDLSNSSNFQPLCSAKQVYNFNISVANNEASSPPAPVTDVCRWNNMKINTLQHVSNYVHAYTN